MFVGLDSTASLDLLTHLNKLAQSNRTVVLTIHQPRLEIFHMFHHLVLLSEGKVRHGLLVTIGIVVAETITFCGFLFFFMIKGCLS